MQSQYPDWLRQLAVDGHGPLTLPAIVRGEAYSHTLRLGIDWSADIFACAIRLVPDAGAVLQAITITKGAWDGEVFDLTLSLTLAEVNTISAAATDGDFNGLAEVFYALQRTSGGATRRVLAGNIPIRSEV